MGSSGKRRLSYRVQPITNNAIRKVFRGDMDMSVRVYTVPSTDEISLGDILKSSDAFVEADVLRATSALLSALNLAARPWVASLLESIADLPMPVERLETVRCAVDAERSFDSLSCCITCCCPPPTRCLAHSTCGCPQLIKTADRTQRDIHDRFSKAIDGGGRCVLPLPQVLLQLVSSYLSTNDMQHKQHKNRRKKKRR